MKKLIIYTIMLVLIISTYVTALADSYSAKLDIEYNYDSNEEKVYIKATINDITAENGIMYCDYNIYYDNSALELVDAKVNIPDSWKSKYDKGIVEDWSRVVEDGHYNWVLLTVAELDGVKNDNQLYITLEFKPLTSTFTTVSFAYSNVNSEVIVGDTIEFVDVSVNSTKVTINTEEPNIPDIDESSTPPVDFDVSEVTSGESSEHVENITSDPEDNVSIPGMPVPPALSDGDDASASVSADISTDGNVTDYITWIIIGIGVLAGVAITIYVLKVKKD